MIYFDHNATTPMLASARQAWLQAAEQFIGNPSSPHRLGARAEAALQAAREQLARYLGCDPLDIVWTSGATESNNLIIHHLSRTVAPHAPVWLSPIEHPSVLEAVRQSFPRRHRFIALDRLGVIDLDWLRKELTKGLPGAVIVMAANNETGIIQPWREALALCREWDAPLFCDATQWVGKKQSSGLGKCHFLSGSAHKFGGPRGVGFVKCHAGRLQSLLLGGPQEEGRRAGTENVPGILSMMAALEARENALQSGQDSCRLQWRQQFEHDLIRLVPGSEMVGASSDRLWNTVSALMPATECQQRWVVKLDKAGFAVSTGSACSSGREEPSHVLLAMGFSPAQAGRVLRFSSGWETTDADWKSLLGALTLVAGRVSRL